MRIEGLHSEKRGDRTRVAATVKWEDCDRPAYELYFETLLSGYKWPKFMSN